MSAVPLSAASDAAVSPASAAPLSLDRLALHAPATVLELRSLGQPDDNERILRLTEIGFVPGEPVRVIAHGFPGREPIAVRIGRSTFALRAHEAALVKVALA
ncbi:FeoA family protein [Xylophilus sp. GOD-11R]|uniref:FeoA family protein n=1 Tax=Xylophilus sp. GOD-11R TaxID=3089814 RepID=UPI00298CC102|nr:FeoA family protein [Xylophilus sp. GOD-11R]WPB56031.1 FeoA family protein [Xylophilus sp. GOD-11R]